MTTYTRREWLIVLVLSLASFTGVLTIYLLTPFLGLVAHEFRLSEAAAGQLATVYAVVGAVVGLLAAPLMDRYQRRGLLQFGLAITGLTTALSAAAPSFVVLLVARALSGFGSVFVMTCCYVAASDAFPDLDRRNRCVGILFSASGIAAVVGVPILTQLATAFGWRWAVASLLVPIVVLAAGASLLPNQKTGARRAGLLTDYLARYRHVLAHRAVSWLLAANLLRNVVWNVPLIYSVSIWIELYHLSLRGYGWLFSAFGMVFFAASNLAPGVIRRGSPYRAFAGGMALQLAAGAGFALTSRSLWGALAAYGVVFCFSGAVVGVALNVLLQDVVVESRGAVLSLSTTTNQAGLALGGLLGGLILATLGPVALIPLISLLAPATVLAGWLSVRRPAPAAGQAEPVEPATA